MNCCKKLLVLNNLWLFTWINNMFLTDQYWYEQFARNTVWSHPVFRRIFSCVFHIWKQKDINICRLQGFFSPCSVQPVQSVVTQPETHTAHCRPVTWHSKNKEHTHCHLREKRNMDDNSDAALSQYIIGLWISVTVWCHVQRPSVAYPAVRTLSQVPLWHWTPQVRDF